MQAMLAQPQAPFLDGLTYEEYAALSEAAEQALWDRLTAAADKQVESAERNIPPHCRPAG